MMRIFHKIPMLLIVLCAQVNMTMAQEAKPEVVPDVWGTYEGEAVSYTHLTLPTNREV